MAYPYPSPLIGYENLPPLPTTLNEDGKSLYNPPGPRSTAYDRFPVERNPGDRANDFDFHVYYKGTDENETRFARELHERIRREFPELRIYRFWDRAVGPHSLPMFEVNTFNPHQTGALFSWLTIHRGPLSVLVHPNTGDAYKDHTALANWMGPPVPLNADFLKGH